MALETATFVAELAPSNPPGTDLRKQGDDHLRLLKAVLQATFPNAAKAFYFPGFSAKTTAYTILSSEANKFFGCASAGGAWALTLPVLVVGDAGWACYAFKADVSQNAVTITPPAGTINGEASLRLNQIYDTVKIVWSGTAWTATVVKSGVRVRAITADTTLVEADLDSLILCTPAANTTITLPAVANYIGRQVTVTHIPSGAFTTTLDGSGAETVAGAATLVLPATRNTVMLIATTTGWESLGSAIAAASTTEVLAGTNTAKAVTPDALAALWEKGSDIASATTISIGEGGTFDVTGTTTITDIDPTTDKVGRIFRLVHEGVHTLTHNASTMICLGGASITTAAGDISTWQSEGSDVVRMVDYARADGSGLTDAAASQAEQEAGSSTTVFTSPGRQHFHPSAAKFWAVVTANGATLSESYNVTSKTDSGAGDLLVTSATDFSTATWCCVQGSNGVIVTGAANGSSRFVYQGTKAAGTIQLLCLAGDALARDPTEPWTVIGFGDHA